MNARPEFTTDAGNFSEFKAERELALVADKTLAFEIRKAVAKRDRFVVLSLPVLRNGGSVDDALNCFRGNHYLDDTGVCIVCGHVDVEEDK